MATIDELRELVALGRETRSLEFKESNPWNALKDKIAKTAMGMSNIRDGGTIIIGVSERSGTLVPQGMSQTEMDTYSSDDIKAYANRFADPYVQLEGQSFEWQGMNFYAINVQEFEQIPIVCKRGGSIVRHGALYTRSYRMPETTEVQSQTEMREVMDLATDKGVRRFLERSRGVGLLAFGGQTNELTSTTHDVHRFDQQLGGL